MKKIIGLLVLILILGLACALADEPVFMENEPNDSRDQANVLCMNAVMKGVLSYDNHYDFDWYKLIVPAGGEIQVHFEHAFVDTSSNVCAVRVYHNASDKQLWGTNINGTQAKVTYYSFYLGSGEYDLVVEGKYRDALNYQLQVFYTEQPTAEAEDNNTPETADVIQVNEIWHGSLSYDNDVDYYLFRLTEPGSVRFHFMHEYFDNGSTFFQTSITKDIGGKTVRAVGFTGRDSDSITYPFYLSAGDYYLRVEKYYHTDMPYQFDIQYEADSATELENNDSFSTATHVQLDTPFKGSFTSDKDVDVYSFTLTEPGRVVLHHEHEYFDDGSTYYNIAVYDDARSDALMFSDNLNGRNSDWTRYGVYLPAGEYYLQYKPYYHTTRPYAFMLQFTPMDNIELENNNAYGSATAIETNKDYYGTLMTDKDIDYYSFTLNETCEIQVNFKFTYFDDGSTYFKLALDTDARNDTTYYARNLKGRDSDHVSYPFYLPAGTYYFHVEHYYHTARPYTLQITAVPCANAELEWNNSYGSATPVVYGQPVTGSLGYDGDIDYYVLTVTNPTTVQLKLSHEWFDDGSTYYQVYLDAQPNNSQRLVSMGVKGNHGDRWSDSVTLQPGTYYIVVEKYYHTVRPYVLTIE